MTLGALGGQIKPLTRAEVIELVKTNPTTNLVTLGRALGVSEPVIRERARRGELAELGIRCLRLGAQWRVVTDDIAKFLNIDLGTVAGSVSETPPAIAVLPSRKGTNDFDQRSTA